MDASLPVRGGLQRRGRQAEDDAQARREIDLVGIEVPVVEAVVDRLHRERVALLVRGLRRIRALLPVGCRRLALCGFELAVALARLRDVRHRADDSVGPSVLVAHRHAVLAAPAPLAAHAAVAEVDLKPRRVALQALDDGFAILWAVVGMDRLGNVAGGVRWVVRLHAQHLAQGLGEIDFAAVEIGVIDRIIDGLHRERVTLFGSRAVA
jgi:hypothetical protein